MEFFFCFWGELLFLVFYKYLEAKQQKLLGENGQAQFPVAKSWERVSFWAF